MNPTTWKQVKVEFDWLLAARTIICWHIDNDGMSSIVTTSKSGTNVNIGSEDVNEL